MDNNTTQIYLLDHLISPISFMVAVSMIGIFGNSCIVLVTMTRKSLQGVCNLLIAIEAASDVLFELWVPSSLYFLLNDQHFMTVRTCWYIQFIPVFCISMSYGITLMIGIDRLLNIIAPIRIRNISQTKYLCILLCFPLISSIVWAILAYGPMLDEADNYVYCTAFEFNRGSLRDAMSYYHLSISGSLVLLYAYIWFLVKTMEVSGATRKILKSLTVITLVMAAGWPASQIGILLTRILFEPKIFMVVVYYFGALLHIGFAMNFYVYFCFSSEYRAAFLHLFSYFCCKKNMSEQVQKLNTPVAMIRIKYNNTVKPKLSPSLTKPTPPKIPN